MLRPSLLLTGCGASPPVDEPTERPAEQTVQPDPDAENAEMTALLNDSIEVVYGSEPQPDWYPALQDLSVSNDGWAAVVTSNPDFAEAMCQNIAAVTFDDNTEPIGVTDVIVFDAAGEVLTDCDGGSSPGPVARPPPHARALASAGAREIAGNYADEPLISPQWTGIRGCEQS